MSSKDSEQGRRIFAQVLIVRLLTLLLQLQVNVKKSVEYILDDRNMPVYGFDYGEPLASPNLGNEEV
jgi:hypothetical protein